MRILFTSGIFPPDVGGPASYVPRMATALTGRGHESQVVCLSDERAPDNQPFPFEVTRIRRDLFKPRRWWKAVRLIAERAREADVVYANGLNAESALGARLVGTPVVFKIVGDYAWERARNRGWFLGTIDEYQQASKDVRLRVLDRVRTWPLLGARRVITPSSYLKEIVSGWGVPAEKVSVIYNAVEQSEAAGCDFETQVDLPAFDGKTLLSVCRLTPWKGVDGLIRLMPSLPEARLVVAGEGAEREKLERLAKREGVAERVRLLGRVPKACVPELMRRADVFALNSTYEGLPHVVLEAMQEGTPVVATDAGGTGEAVKDGETGRLVPLHDAHKLREAVRSLLEDDAEAVMLANQAQENLDRRFGYERMVDRTEKELREAISQSVR